MFSAHCPYLPEDLMLPVQNFSASPSFLFFWHYRNHLFCCYRQTTIQSTWYSRHGSIGNYLSLIFIVILTEVADTGIFQLGFCLMIASIALAHICLLHHFNLQNKYALYARMTATSAIAIFSLILIVKVLNLSQVCIV